MKRYKAVIFDLDGTLLNTLEDLTDAVNHVMRQFNYPEHTIEEIRSFVGNGIKLLIERSLPDGKDNPEFDKIFSEFKLYYTSHCQIKTRPYDGIMELIAALKEQGYKLAIVSNKNQSAVTELNNIYFSDYISTAIGEKEGVRKKPAPDTVIKALSELGISSDDAVYVGDSDVDRETAENSNMDCISVTWGFRDRKLLESLNPYAIIDKPAELLNYV
ncbi:MAG: HAD-IA family hydrolase [Lachnospiraceae bacterium]|nr:HAD-IA family hydrolase [Lachnospiraceae bacterium]